MYAFQDSWYITCKTAILSFQPCFRLVKPTTLILQGTSMHNVSNYEPLWKRIARTTIEDTSLMLSPIGDCSWVVPERFMNYCNILGKETQKWERIPCKGSYNSQ